MKFVTFHDQDNNEVRIAHRWVTKIRKPVVGQQSVKTNAVVMIGQNEQAVIETIAEVVKILEEADGPQDGISANIADPNTDRPADTT